MTTPLFSPVAPPSASRLRRGLFIARACWMTVCAACAAWIEPATNREPI